MQDLIPQRLTPVVPKSLGKEKEKEKISVSSPMLKRGATDTRLLARSAVRDTHTSQSSSYCPFDINAHESTMALTNALG